MPVDAVDNASLGEAVRLLRSARALSAFTGAGISVESGIPPFRGSGGVWERYDPRTLEIGFYLRHPEESWPVIRSLFFAAFAGAQPNAAHRALARLEEAGLLKWLITQNIDNLHHRAGSRSVIEYHGNSRMLACTRCGLRVPVPVELPEDLPPRCGCGALTKPDFVFFGEAIPPEAAREADRVARETDVMLVVGSTGEVHPAAALPHEAARRGAAIIEINPQPSLFTPGITDIFLPMKAAEALPALAGALGLFP